MTQHNTTGAGRQAGRVAVVALSIGVVLGLAALSGLLAARASLGNRSGAGAPDRSPALRAAVDALLVTDTQLHTVLSIGPAVTGLYRVSGSFYISQPGPSFVTFDVTYISGNDGAEQETISFETGATLVQGAGLGKGEWATQAITVYDHAGAMITVSYQDATGSPHDAVSVAIEFLG